MSGLAPSNLEEYVSSSLGTSGDLLELSIRVGSEHRVHSALLDSGASHNFCSVSSASDAGFEIHEASVLRVRLATRIYV